MPKVTKSPITIFLTPKCKIFDSYTKVGETHAGFDMRGFDLVGKTGIRNRSYCTEGLNACTGGIFLGKSLNMFHENSSLYGDAEGTKRKVFNALTNKISKMASETKEKLQAFLFGGWGYENKHNADEIAKSHNLFNNIALYIEDILPHKEGIEVPLTTIWGKINSSSPDTVLCRENTIVLENDVFKYLFQKGKTPYNREDLIKFLEDNYEEVQVPDSVNLIAKEKYISSGNINENLKLRENINLKV